MKRKIFCLIITILLSMSVVFVAGCNNDKDKDTAFEIAQESTLVWLDRYDEADVKLIKGDASTLKWKSNDESVVTVISGRLIAEGKGQTTVDVSSGKTKAEITVKVRDSGTLPTIAFETFNAYLGVESNIPQTIKYNAIESKANITFTAEIVDETVMQYVGGKTKGLKLGSTVVKLKADYKGLTLRKTVTATVTEPLTLTFSDEHIDIYNVEGKLGKAEYSAQLMYLGEELTDKQITYEVTTGADLIRVENGKVFALKEGEAVLTATYTADGKTVSDTLNITVNPNYATTSYTNVSTKGITWEKYNEEIGGRQGDIMKYRPADSISEGSWFDHRISEVSAGKRILELYKKGYRYFSYDVYYTSNENLMVGCGAFFSWITVGDYFRKDYLSISCDGEMTNRLEKNKWLTVSYDLRALWLMDMGKTADFFFFTLDASTSYIMNTRYYLDDAFLPSENLSYEKKDGYTQATNDEFDVMTPISKGYNKEGVPSVVVNPGEAPTYGKHTDIVGGRSTAYKYQANTASGWKNALIVASSMNESYDESIQELQQLGKFLTFDIYPEKANALTFYMNHTLNSAKIELGKTNLGQYENWLTVIKDGKKQNTITLNAWQTVSIAFADNYQDEAFGASMMFTAENNGDVVYIDNVRYMASGDFIPEEYEEETICPIIKSGAAGVTITRLSSGDFKGAYKYTNTTSGSAESGVNFKGVVNADGTNGAYFTDGYKFVKFELYIAENVTSITLNSSAERNYTNYSAQNIVVGEAFGDKDVHAFTDEGLEAKKLERGSWYTIYIPTTYSSSDIGKAEISITINGGSSALPAVAYIKYLSYVYTIDSVYLNPNAGNLSAYTSVDYQTKGAFANTWKYINGTPGELDGLGQNWGEAGAVFSRVTKDNNTGSGGFFKEGYKWIKTDFYIGENTDSISIRCTSDRNMTNYWNKLIKIGSNDADAINVVDASGDRVSKIARDKWYTLYIPVEYTNIDTGNTYIMLYTNGGSVAKPSIMYFKNLEYLKSATIPDPKPIEKPAIYVRNSAFENNVKVTQEDDGSWKYVNETSGRDPGNRPNAGESGICFEQLNKKGGAKGEFYTNGNKYLKFDMKVAENVHSIDFNFGKGIPTNSYWLESVPVGSPLPANRQLNLFDANGKRAEIIQRNEWYTLYMAAHFEDSANCVFTNGGSVANPAVMYLKNLEYTKEVPLTSISVYANGGTVEKMTSGDNLGAWKYSCKESNKENSIGFSGIIHYNSTSAEEMSGIFFYGYHYLKAEVNFTTATKLTFSMSGQALEGLTSPQNNTLEVGKAPSDKFLVLDASGKKVTGVIEANTWYTIYLKIEYSKSVGWTDFFAYSSGGTVSTPAVMYLKELEMLKTLPIIK